MMMKYPFNKPHITGKETFYIHDAVASGKLSGNGKYTQLCQKFFEDKWGFRKTLLTTSCTDALEMCALLLGIKPEDEVIVPSYTFVSTALAFVRQGARIVFADSRIDHPGINESSLENLITPKTKIIVPVHYAGVACDMNKICGIARRHNLFVVEDAAQAIDSTYKDEEITMPLGSIGHLAVFSFHETKNIQCGEGGMLAVNDDRFIRRSEIIWEKGTDRAAYFRGEVDKYGWVDLGSSFLPSEVTAAFLWAQIENLEEIQRKRLNIWSRYMEDLKEWAENNEIQIPFIPEYASNNAHMFYMVLPSLKTRERMIKHLKEREINSVFHYQSLHKSLFYVNMHDGRNLPNADRYSDCLLRLPMYIGLDNEYIIKTVCDYKI